MALEDKGRIVCNQTIRRNSFAYLVTKGLGYCCPWFFLNRFAGSRITTIAERLGCSTQTVYRARRDLPYTTCTACPSCMKSLLSRRP